MKSRAIVVALIVAMSGLVVSAQKSKDTQRPAAPPPVSTPPVETPPVDTPPAGALAQRRDAQALVPLKVTVVLSRHQGDKKISSLPFTLGVTANSAKTSLRMGSEVPIGRVSAEDARIPQAGFSYRNVGTTIDCQAFTAAAGSFRLTLTVSDSSVQLDKAGEVTGVGGKVIEAPIFRTFNSSFTVLLRDRQATQHTSATDPVTGEVMKIDLTLNVLK